MSDELQLSDLSQQVPPRVVCSDFVQSKQEWSAGLEDGYYPAQGTFFSCVSKFPSRSDSRLKNSIGPVIHLDTHSLRAPNLQPYVEEVIHYLQWLHQTPKEVLDKIISWRAIYEEDPQLREPSVDALRSRGIGFHFQTTTTDSGLLMASSGSWSPQTININGEKPELEINEELLASRIMYEAVAELMRLRFGVSSMQLLGDFFSEWEGRGITGWNKECMSCSSREPSTDLVTDYSNSASECYRLFMELPISEFMQELKVRNGNNDLNKVSQFSSMVSQGKGSFPDDIVHFLGYGLGQSLYQSGFFDEKAGLQEASLRFFSPLVSAVDRLKSMKELID